MGGSQLTYRRIRAPQEDGSTLISPALESIADTLLANQSMRSGHQSQLLDQPLHEVAKQAKSHLLQAAHQYTSTYREVARPDPHAAIILSGHQPDLFHPGVWFKNILLSYLGQKHQATAISLVMDNDTQQTSAIRVLGGTPDQPRSVSVRFDRSDEPLPVERRFLQDESLWQSFPERVTQAIAPWIDQPLVGQLWRKVMQLPWREQPIGWSLAQGRHQLEASWGMQTLEVPLSRVTESTAYHRFVGHLIAHADQMHPLYNEALAQYRQIHRIKNHAQPAPDLATDGHWLEVPLWISTPEDPVRRGLFARRCTTGWELSDRDQFNRLLPWNPNGSAEPTIETLADWSAESIAIRPRAFTATMFARLLLGDLFIHGIGGAKYDQLTDLLIERFFQVTAPSYLTSTATVQLPIAYEPVDQQRRQWLLSTLRSLTYHPEKHLPSGKEAQDSQTRGNIRSLEEAKNHLLQAQPPRGARRRWHEQLTQTNLQFQPYVQQQRIAFQEEWESLQRQMRRSSLLGSREYSFVLFPEETIRQRLLDSLSAVP